VSNIPSRFDVSSLESEFARFGIVQTTETSKEKVQPATTEDKKVDEDTKDDEDKKDEEKEEKETAANDAGRQTVTVVYASRSEAEEAAKVRNRFSI
jgi:hypothetical protein